MNKTVTHCIGNSHIWMFQGGDEFPPTRYHLPEFRTHHIGAVIAYNFMTSHMPKVREILAGIPKDENVMLVVGEVDCRWHLPFQANKQQRDPVGLTIECVDRLFECMLEIKGLGHNLIGWATHPTTTDGHTDYVDGPVFGEVAARNKICVAWNERLEQRCSENGIPFVSIYRHLVDENNITKMEFFLDYCHLNPVKCVPFVQEEFEKKIYV